MGGGGGEGNKTDFIINIVIFYFRGKGVSSKFNLRKVKNDNLYRTICQVI